MCQMHVLGARQRRFQKKLGQVRSLFDAAADVEWLRGAAVELHSPLHVDVEGLNQTV